MSEARHLINKTLSGRLMPGFCCIHRHSGRVLQLAKCAGCGSQLGSSTTTRPLVPQKRTAEQSSLPAAKKTGATSQSRPLNASSSQSSAAAGAFTQLQVTVSELEARVSALTNPKPFLTAEQVIELIDTRLAQQRQEFHQAIQELQHLCETGFVSTQASFDAVGDWKEEVQQSFTKIQDWATAVEQKLVGAHASIPSQAISDTSIQTRHISSTPLPGPVPAWHTPAAPLIATAPPTRRLSRLSDALDFSLATIPEAPNTPLSSDERRPLSDAASAHPKSEKSDTMTPGVKHVRICALAEVIDKSEDDEPTSDHVLAEQVASRISTEEQASQPLIAFTPKQVTCTPRSAKTLFGTEQSSEARFDDILEIMDDSVGQEPSMLPPTWASLSPSRLLKEA